MAVPVPARPTRSRWIFYDLRTPRRRAPQWHLPSYGAGTSLAIQFISDGNTPSEYLSYAGNTYYLPAPYMSTLGSTVAEAARLLGIPGYHIAAGSIGHQWLMIDPLPATLTAGILAIPVRGWLTAASLWEYRARAYTLLFINKVDAATTLQMLTDLYNAALNEPN